MRSEVTGGATDLMDRCGDHDVPYAARATSQGGKPVSGGLERVADVPIYFADALVRRSPPLQATHDAAPPTARLNGRAMAAAGLASGDRVRVAMEGGDCVLACLQDETVADGCIRVATAHPSTASLPAPFGTVTIEKVRRARPRTPPRRCAHDRLDHHRTARPRSASCGRSSTTSSRSSAWSVR